MGVRTRTALMSTTSMVAFTVLGAAMYATLPMMVGALIEALGLTARQAGLIAAADMLGASASALMAGLSVSSGRWRTILLIGVLLLTMGNALSGLTSGFTPLFACRVCAGLGEGLLLVIGNASIAEVSTPDRVFGLSLAAQVAFGALALWLIPWMLHFSGAAGIFWSLSLLTALGTALIRYMPDQPRAAARSAAQPAFTAGSALGLVGVLTYFAAQGAVWAYLERIGTIRHIEAGAIGRALAMSSLAGLAGAFASSLLGVRAGRLGPLLIGTLFTLVSLAVFNSRVGLALFTAAAGLFNFAWYFSVPFQFGALAEIDDSRRTVALGTVVVFAGVALGPMLAAGIIGGGQYERISWMGMFFTILSFLLFAWLLWPVRRKSGVEGMSSDTNVAARNCGQN